MKLTELIRSLPPEWSGDVTAEIAQAVHASKTKIVVLDDDPTGSQTVHDVDVLMGWDVESLVAALQNPENVVFILTNSRSMDEAQAVAINVEIVNNLNTASVQTGRDFAIVSRSDSTLRGHFPAETDAIQSALITPVGGVLVIPFFTEGGRITANDTHYVTVGDEVIPAADTEYASDPTFGYHASNLKAWVEEKTQGRVLSSEVQSITLDDIRTGGAEEVAAKLMDIHDGQVCLVNSVSYQDLTVFVAGLLRAETAGKRFLYRTAASFVRTRGAIAPASLLTANDLPAGEGGGLIVAGSYVGKTSRQLEYLRSEQDMVWVELSVKQVLDDTRRDYEIARAASCISEALSKGENVVLFTSRERIEVEQSAFLKVGELISQTLVDVVSGLTIRPAWVIAKGGITSSVIATDALNMQTSRVLGQVIPGVPVWMTGDESRWPGMVYVVFPGNVGDDSAVTDMVKTLIDAGDIANA